MMKKLASACTGKKSFRSSKYFFMICDELVGNLWIFSENAHPEELRTVFGAILGLSNKKL